ncbi:MFS transporter [Salinicola corii]|uniref:MFS transporter n=1 Tax=Salinicola corii TaxID=2606937 RepID=A0A640W7J6_9GAMM|nr:MFS transporter [Salinicola corii]KAA0015600.1 MFS transporter [Salinicola corii]
MAEARFNRMEIHVLLTVCLSMFIIPLTITSSSILNLSIMNDYSLKYQEAQWFINIFMVMYAAFLPVTGSISDYVGKKNVFLFGLALLAMGFLLGGLANNYMLLLASRAVSGIAAAAVTTSATSLLASHVDKTKKARAFSIFGVFLGIGMISGPLIASGLSYIDHGWLIFSAGMASFLFVMLISLVLISAKAHRASHPFDWVGGFLLTVFLLSSVMVVSFLPVWTFNNPRTLSLLLVSVLIGSLLYRVERKSEYPLIDIRIFRNRDFSAMSITSLLLGFGYISVLFYFPLYLSKVTEFSALQMGSIMTAATLPSLVFPSIIAKFRSKLSDAFLLKVTLFFLISSPLFLSKITGSESVLLHQIAMFLFGASFGISLSYIDGVAVNSVPAHQAGLAAGTFNTFRIGGESIFIPLTSSVATLLNTTLGGKVEHTLNMGYRFIGNAHESFITSTSLLLIVVSVLCFIFSVVILNFCRLNKNRDQVHEISQE